MWSANHSERMTTAHPVALQSPATMLEADSSSSAARLRMRSFPRWMRTSCRPWATAPSGDRVPTEAAVLSRSILRYAASLHQPVLALHLSPTEEESKRFRDYWATWGNHVPLELIQSPYRAVIPPIVAYIESLHAQRPDLTLTVIVPDLACVIGGSDHYTRTTPSGSGTRSRRCRRSSSPAFRCTSSDAGEMVREGRAPGRGRRLRRDRGRRAWRRCDAGVS